MNSLIHLFKDLYAYCTDFIINLANITGLSYYEVNFIIFIILYPLLLLVSPIVFLIQKSRLRALKFNTTPTSKSKTFAYFENLKTFNKRKIFITANLAWLFIMVAGTSRAFSESAQYYTYHLSRGDYARDSDSISIPIFDDTFSAFFILFLLLILLNIFIFLTTRKGNLPTTLFVKADDYNTPVIFWEFLFGILILINILFFIARIWDRLYIESLITLFFTFILLNLRAGQISKYKQTIENAGL